MSLGKPANFLISWWFVLNLFAIAQQGERVFYFYIIYLIHFSVARRGACFLSGCLTLTGHAMSSFPQIAHKPQNVAVLCKVSGKYAML